MSPGLIPGTNLSRYGGMKMDMSMPDAKSVPEGMIAYVPEPRPPHLLCSFLPLEEFNISRPMD